MLASLVAPGLVESTTKLPLNVSPLLFARNRSHADDLDERELSTLHPAREFRKNSSLQGKTRGVFAEISRGGHSITCSGLKASRGAVVRLTTEVRRM